MPRNRRDDAETNTSLKSNDIEEDYLDVDKPLNGQNYYCISFVSPEKILIQKDQFMFYHYERAVNKKLSTMIDETLAKMIDASDDGKIDISDVIALKKSVAASCQEYDVTFEQFKDKMEDFKFQNEEKIGEDFDKKNNFRTSVRGVKVRGVFDTKREADVRASVLQRQDALFDVFVGQIGYWCPWDPNPQKIDDIEYMNNDLNKLVKEYKSNEAKKDMFYQEQKTQRQKDALSAEDRLKHQEGLNKMTEFRESLKSGNKPDVDSSVVSTLNDTGLIDSKGITLDALMNISEETDSSTGGSSTPVDEKPQAITQSLELGGENSKEITVEEQTEVLMSDDPWLQRKMAESKPLV